MVYLEASQAVKLDALGALIECMLYGGFLVLMIITLVSTFRKTITPQIIRIHLVGLIMLCLASIHIVSNACRIVKGLGGDGGILEEFSSPIFLLKQATSMLQVILGDAYWLYRLHIVWEGNKRVTYPFAFLLISTTSLWVFTIILSGKIPAGASITREAAIAAAVTVFLALASSVGVTTLIAFRVCCVSRRVEDVSRSTMGQARNMLKDFIVLVIESGAIYTAFVLAFFVSILCGSSVYLIPDQAIIQVVGIVYYMMLFQSTLPRANQYSRTQTETRSRIVRQAEDIEPPRPVVVHVTKWETRR